MSATSKTSTRHFYPRSPCGERPVKCFKLRRLNVFLSTLSLRRATHGWPFRHNADTFLSTLSLRRATCIPPGTIRPGTISIHALLAESDYGTGPGVLTVGDFYPRSPCGERRQLVQLRCILPLISIHALLAESDVYSRQRCEPCRRFLSTLSLRRATVCARLYITLSRNFYPRSPCGERQTVIDGVIGTIKFLSTLSLRRATADRRGPSVARRISIHALLAESDGKKIKWCCSIRDFYPRSPCGERPGFDSGAFVPAEISIHALLAESDGQPSSV